MAGRVQILDFQRASSKRWSRQYDGSSIINNHFNTAQAISKTKKVSAASAPPSPIMDHQEEHSSSSSPCFRILVWPDSLLRRQCDNKKPGFLIGWSSSSSLLNTPHKDDEVDNDNDDDDRRRRLLRAAAAAAYPPMLVVAGLVQVSEVNDGHDNDHPDNRSVIHQHRARLENRLEKIRASLGQRTPHTSSLSQQQDDDSKKHKTDNSTSLFSDNDDITSSCWNDLRVIAWYDPTIDSKSSLAATNDDDANFDWKKLPRISLMSTASSSVFDDGFLSAATRVQTYPWFVLNHGQNIQQNNSKITNDQEYQVIFYDDDDSTIYNNNNGYHASSSSTKSGMMSFYSILPKITNASQIMKIIHSFSSEDDERLGYTPYSIQMTTKSDEHLQDDVSSKVDNNSLDQTVKQETAVGDHSSSSHDEMGNDSFWWQRVYRFVSKRSFLLVIFRQLTSSNNNNAAIPLLRFIHALKLHKQLVLHHQQQEKLAREEKERDHHHYPHHHHPASLRLAGHTTNHDEDDDEAMDSNKDDNHLSWPNNNKHKRMHLLVHCWDEEVMSGLDAIMGILLAWIIVRTFWLHSFSLHDPAFATTSSSSSWSLQGMIQSHFQFLWDSTVWLESFPIGFKLNEQLTANLGHKIRSLMTLYQWLLLQILRRNTLVVQACVMVISSFIALVFGAFGFVALVMDVFQCFMIHVSLFAFLFGSIVRAELYLLAALWRLFRGKKRNPLRHRTDTMEYDSLQLLVGIIVFSVSLFLFTTIGIYHAFFAALNLVMVVFVSFTCILLCIVLWKKFPWGKLVLRYYHPGWFTKSMYIAAEFHHGTCTDASTMKSITATSMTVDVTRLQTIPCSYGSILMGGLIHRNPAMSNLMTWLLKQLVDPLRSGPSLHNDDQCLVSVFKVLMDPDESILETT